MVYPALERVPQPGKLLVRIYTVFQEETGLLVIPLELGDLLAGGKGRGIAPGSALAVQQVQITQIERLVAAHLSAGAFAGRAAPEGVPFWLDWFGCRGLRPRLRRRRSLSRSR